MNICSFYIIDKKMDNIDPAQLLEEIWGLSFLYTGIANFRDSGNKLC